MDDKRKHIREYYQLRRKDTKSLKNRDDKRPCLYCGKLFLPQSKFNRFCGLCKDNGAFSADTKVEYKSHQGGY